MKLLIMQFSPIITSSLFDPNILLNTLFYAPSLMTDVKIHNNTEPQARL
jgi:hypothetical protein